MIPRTAVLTVAGFLLSLLSAAADEVILRNGQSIQGIVSEEGDWVVVVVDGGTIRLPASQVAKVIRSESPLQIFLKRRAALKDDDVKGLLDLAEWADKKGLYTKAREVYRQVLRAAPANRTAREALGYIRYRGKWLTEEEYWTTRGYVKSEGEWVPRDVAIAREKEAEETRRRREQLKMEMRIAELRQEVERARIEVERLRAENERRIGRRVVILPHYHYSGPVRRPCWCRKSPE